MHKSFHGAARLLLGACAALAGAGATAATFFPEQSAPLSEVEVEALARSTGARLTEDSLIIDDMVFARRQLILSGFSAPRWPRGELIYDARNLTADQKVKFIAACNVWSAVSAVRCIARTNQTGGYVKVRKVAGNTSSASVGYPGAGFTSSLSLCCFNDRRHIAHELGHVLGLSHEHMRSDRDTYVRIHKENMLKKYWPQFEKRQTENYGAYDFRSGMHYRAYARSKNGRPTIVVLPPNQAMQRVIGTVSEMSQLDLQGMAARYPRTR